MNHQVVRNVTLHGSLQQYGEVHEFAFARISQFVAMIEAAHPGFESDVASGRFNVVVSNGRGRHDVLTPDTILMELLDDDINVDIVPVVDGQKGAGEQALIAAALIGVSLVNPVAGTFAANVLMTAGTTLAFTAVSSALAPVPEDVSDSPVSSIYRGGVNRTGAGGMIPIVLGHTLTDSLQVSFGIDAEEMGVEAATTNDPAIGEFIS